MRIFTNLSPFQSEIAQGQIQSGRQLQQRAFEAGFDGVEMSLALLNHPVGRRLFDDLDCTAATFHSDTKEFSLGWANPYLHRAAVEQLRDELAMAMDQGVGVLTIHPGVEGKTLTREASHDRVISGLRQVLETHGDRLQESNTVLALENMGPNPQKLCRTAEEVECVLSALSHPSVGVTFDLAHCAIGEYDVSRYLDEMGHWIRHVHVSGYQPGGSHKEISLADSGIDLRPFIRRLAGRNVRFCIENETLEIAEKSRRILGEVRKSLR